MTRRLFGPFLAALGIAGAQKQNERPPATIQPNMGINRDSWQNEPHTLSAPSKDIPKPAPDGYDPDQPSGTDYNIQFQDPSPTDAQLTIWLDSTAGTVSLRSRSGEVLRFNHADLWRLAKRFRRDLDCENTACFVESGGTAPIK